jgi:hypothetical protein
MSATSQQLAEQYARTNWDLIQAVASLSEHHWQDACAEEGGTVGVTAHHLAVTVPLILAGARGIMAGQALPANTVELTNQANAQHAREHAACTREDTTR